MPFFLFLRTEKVDGEPWAQDPCTIHVDFHKQVRMLHKSIDTCSFRSFDAEDPQIKHKRQNNLLKSENSRLIAENSLLRTDLEKIKKELEATQKELKILNKQN
jgi:hypothetical protein